MHTCSRRIWPEKDLALPAPQVGDIVRGKRAISADAALRLGICFGLPAQNGPTGPEMRNRMTHPKAAFRKKILSWRGRYRQRVCCR
jgi:hypothetical protein